MELNKEHIDDLIAKYLAGEALPEEAMLLDEWKNKSVENLQYFSDSEKAFGIAVPIGQTNTQELFQRILGQLEQPYQQQDKIVALKPGTYFTPLRIAASLVAVALIGIFATYLFRGVPAEPEMMIASADSIQQQKLTDGSKVILNKHTRLIVEKGFNGKQRKLKLEGEAFFEVVHNQEKPFVIEAGGIQIKDIGTAFNVKADPQSDSVTVSVSEGIVDITNGDQTVQLLANQSVVYIRSTHRMKAINNIANNVASYRTKVFHFTAATLGEVITAVNSVYGPLIELENPDLAACRITVEFNNESPETIVAIISETLGLIYENKNGRYELKGASCIQ